MRILSLSLLVSALFFAMGLVIACAPNEGELDMAQFRPTVGHQPASTPATADAPMSLQPGPILTSQDAISRALELFSPTPITTTVRLVSMETVFETWLESTVPEIYDTRSPIWLVAFEVTGYRLLDLVPPMSAVGETETASSPEVAGYYYVFEANGGIDFMEGVLFDEDSEQGSETPYSVTRIASLSNEPLTITAATPFPSPPPLP